MAKNKYFRSGANVRGHYRGGTWIPPHERSSALVSPRDANDRGGDSGLSQPGNSGSCYTSRCIWCESSVYYYRSDNGGFAMFDAIGKPWPLHSCWIERDHSLIGDCDIPLPIGFGLCDFMVDVNDVPPRFPDAGKSAGKFDRIEQKVRELEAQMQNLLARLRVLEDTATADHLATESAEAVSSNGKHRPTAKWEPEFISLVCRLCGERSRVEYLHVMECPNCKAVHWRDNR